MLLRCLACLTEYESRDGKRGDPPHVCGPEVVEHAKFSKQGKLLTPEKRTARAIIRNENWTKAPGEDAPRIVSEGKGVKKVS